MDTLKILVVDDESRMRKLVKDFLTKKNFQVLEAGDGEEAMDIFYKEKDIALIILDVMMPKMDGWEVCREVRKNSKVPIIMLTARGDERDELLGFDLGVDEYISKPFSPKILVARVEAILRRTGSIRLPILQQSMTSLWILALRNLSFLLTFWKIRELLFPGKKSLILFGIMIISEMPEPLTHM